MRLRGTSLFDHGMDINIKTNDGKTALNLAVKNGHRELAEFRRARGGR
jgi:ankyrin repeat protein